MDPLVISLILVYVSSLLGWVIDPRVRYTASQDVSTKVMFFSLIGHVLGILGWGLFLFVVATSPHRIDRIVNCILAQ